jgi:superfamily II DNA or RNA helicase
MMETKQPHNTPENIPDYTQYEHAMVARHNLENDTRAWHWQNVPEELLHRSGYICSFNRRRLERLKRQRTGQNPLRDYGLDGLYEKSLGDTVIYGGLQAKYWTTKAVGVKDVASFLDIQNRIRCTHPTSQGYLYTNCRLQPDLADSCDHPGYPIQHIRYDWKPQSTTDTSETPIIPESQLVLRPYQKQALEYFDIYQPLRGVLNIPCGLGKTLIAGHLLAKRKYPLIIAIAPLKCSVDNLQMRLMPFLPLDTQALLVDSDTQGTTDPEEITAWLTNHQERPRVIFSTYKSTLEVLQTLEERTENSCLVIDEVHNATPELLDYLENFSDYLAMTASLPDEVWEAFPEQSRIFRVSLADAIRDGYLVDYTIWLPETAGVQSIEQQGKFQPKRLKELFQHELSPRAFYLINGMLKTGSRRCIAYLSNREECSVFQRLFQQVCLKYHGISVWTDQVDCEVSTNRRREIFKAFQESSFAVLTSVRVLDEAVDLVRCDSIFVGNIGAQASDIRMIQRWGRSSRLDPRNLAKHNHIFLWAEDRERCVNVLSLLKDSDPEFHKKLRVVGMEYAKQGSKEIMEGLREEEEKLQDWSRIVCVSYDERRMQWVQLLLEFVEKEQRIPIREEIYKGCHIGYFWGNIKNRQEQEWLKKVLHLHNDILRLDYETFTEKRNNRLTTEEVIQLCIEFADNFKRCPKRREKYKNFNIGHTWCSFKMGRCQQYAYILLAHPIFKAEYDAFIQQKEVKMSVKDKVDLLLEFVKKHKRLPKTNEEYQGIFLRRVWGHIRKYGKHNDELLKQLLENPILREDYNNYNLDTITHRMKLDILLEFVNQMKRAPIGTDEYKNIKIGQFWGSIKRGCNKELLSLALQNSYLLEDYEQYQRSKEERLSPQEQLQELIIDANRLERVPNEKEKGGNFWRGMKRGCHKDLLPLALQNPYLKANYEQFQSRTKKN